MPIPPELTPPPQEPPPPESIDGFDTIAPPIREQIKLLSDGLAELSNYVASRAGLLDESRLVRIEATLGSLGVTGTDHKVTLAQLGHDIRQLMASTAGIEGQLPRFITSIEALSITVSNLDHRVRDVEVKFGQMAERFSNQHQALDESLKKAHAKIDTLEAKIDALEQHNRDESVADDAVKTLTATQWKWISAGAAILGAVGVPLVRHFLGI